MTLGNNKRTEPLNGGLMDPRFVYRNSASTNVLETFRRWGWTPPSEQRQQQQEQGKPNA
jgi:hypothetical protein